MDLTERRDLRGGRPCWIAPENAVISTDALPGHEVDIAIIGAGVMGAMLGERLARKGRSVLLLDRRPPAHGSTGASTALVMWGADVPLSHLARDIGYSEASRRWRRMFKAVSELAIQIEEGGIDCEWVERPELYLAGTLLDAAGLETEARTRRAVGLPSMFWTCFEKVESFPEVKGELDDEATTVYKGIRGRGGPAGSDQRAHAA
ncbi:MAG: FAD-dependent oxidoreductase [Candidatus Sphingomonas colombiensis]|nr:FAD-dependent oxidoreductase [Sphingomonas sp.]WEK43398.1 MAG: FAD-dependent oxidoreductase [Sphingomonas sp.]